MAATHVVSLFLPNTLSFYNAEDQDDKPTPPSQNARLEKRKSSKMELPMRASSAVSLLHGPTPPHTPNTAVEEFFANFGPETQKRHFAKPGDPRSLVQTDVDVPMRDIEKAFNQPRSRAGPLPSNSILDFAKAQEELKEQRLRAAKKKTRSPTQSRASRAQSIERSYDNKAWTVEPALQGNSGLTNAMRSAVSSSDIEVSWMGTLGFPTDCLSKHKKAEINDHLVNEYQSEVVYVNDRDLDGHYSHYCKTILWPIFHYQVPDHPKSKAYADHSWEFYRNVNQSFADKIVERYKRGDTIWVHDYHLLLVPGMVRKKLPDAQIGFFLHTAFPSSEIFRCLSTRKDLLEGMLGANLVAFQVDEYATHFLQTCSRLLTVETTPEGVQLEDRFVNVTSQPIGINPSATHEARLDVEVKEAIESLKSMYENVRLIVARDKLDNVHGVREKLLAFELFLNKYPEWAGKVVLLQVATSTSEQAELLTTVSDIQARIMETHSSLTHQPLMFLKKDIEFSKYLALLTVADAVMITSLRDGMNLTAHEYIFCQDGMDGGKKHGPLILSEFAGSAAMLRGHLPINPWDYQKHADAIKEALEMSVEEKERRWNGLHSVVLQQTGGHWADELAKKLIKVHEEHNQRASSSIPRLSASTVIEKYRQSKRRVFIIDYEGTLAPHKTSDGLPLIQPHRIIDTLNDLMTDSKNTVYVMSALKPEELERVFRTANGLGLIAENGCYVRGYGPASGSWKSQVDIDQVRAWKKDLKKILNYHRERMEGSYVEERHCSLILRYEKFEDQEAAIRQAGECAEAINTSCKSVRIQAIPIHKAVLVEQADFSKATAATHIFDQICKDSSAHNSEAPDFLMVAGDDREDEPVFRWANELGKQGLVQDVFTVSVGKRNTEAQAALTQGSTGLITVLQKLAKLSLD